MTAQGTIINPQKGICPGVLMETRKTNPVLGKEIRSIISGKYGLAYCLASCGWKYQGMSAKEVLEAIEKER